MKVSIRSLFISLVAQTVALSCGDNRLSIDQRGSSANTGTSSASGEGDSLQRTNAPRFDTFGLTEGLSCQGQPTDLAQQATIPNPFLFQDGGCKSCVNGVVFSEQKDPSTLLNTEFSGTGPLGPYFKMTYEASVQYCNDLNTQKHRGFSDWRMPTVEDVMMAGGLEPAWNGSSLVNRLETRFYLQKSPSGSLRSFQLGPEPLIGSGPLLPGPGAVKNGRTSPKSNALAICVRTTNPGCKDVSSANFEAFVKGSLAKLDGRYYIVATYGRPLPSNVLEGTKRTSFLTYSDATNGTTKRVLSALPEEGAAALQSKSSGKIWLDVASSAAVQTISGLMPIDAALGKRVMVRGVLNLYSQKLSDYPKFIKLIQPNAYIDSANGSRVEIAPDPKAKPTRRNEGGEGNCSLEEDNGFTSGFDGCEDRRPENVRHRLSWATTRQFSFLGATPSLFFAKKKDGAKEAVPLNNEGAFAQASTFCRSLELPGGPKWRLATNAELENSFGSLTRLDRSRMFLDRIRAADYGVVGLFPKYSLGQSDFGGTFNRKAVGTLGSLTPTIDYSERGMGKIGAVGGLSGVAILVEEIAASAGFDFIRPVQSGAIRPVYDVDFTSEEVFFSCVRTVARPDGLKSMYRTFNPGNKRHFFTSNPQEYDSVIQNLRFGAEGEAFVMANESFSGSVPVLRLYNRLSDTHYYTTSEAEKNSLLALNPAAPSPAVWNFEGIQGHIYPLTADRQKAGPEIFRLYNRATGAHWYSTDVAEKDELLRAGYEKHDSLGYSPKK